MGTADWIAWVAPLGGLGGALYRSLVLTEGTVGVAVDLLPHPGSGTRTVHRGRCDLSRHPAEATEQVRRLLAAADTATMRMVEATRRQGDEADRRGSHLRPRSNGPRAGGRDGAPDALNAVERRVRERAYFLWERAGRPEGRAEEFWERACQEEVHAA